MKKTVLSVFVLLLGSGQAPAAEWVSLSKALVEPDVRFVAADPAAPERVFAATSKAVYATADGGGRWKRVLSLGGGSPRLRFLRAARGAVYAGSDRGLHRSTDGGRRWTLLYRASGERSGAPLDLAVDPKNPALLWLAAENGLFLVHSRTGESKRIPAFGHAAVYSVLAKDASVLAAAGNGVHKSGDGGESWEPVYTALKTEGEPVSTLEQFDVEEVSMPSTLPFSSLAYLASEDAFFAASKDGLLRGSLAAGGWSVLDGQSFESRRVNGLAPSGRALYVATDKGVYRWDRTALREISGGLETREVRDVSYHPSGDYLLAATPNGVYKLSHPELSFAVSPKEFPSPPVEDVLRRFDGEPSVREVQDAAIRYAEVHPDKIETWRRAAARKALLPTVSLGADLSRDRNVDVDRGGTGDPDYFIMGPEERSLDWSVGLSWSLGDLIWNDDQTSIDTRSRLMVELRDDVLNDVTHLYYERRRLQAEMALAPPADSFAKIEKELKLEELTARIDALTAGYLSRRLAGEKAA